MYVKKERISILWLIAAVIVLIIGAGGYLFYKNLPKTAESLAKDNKDKISNSVRADKVQVVRAREELQTGELASRVRFELIELSRELVPDDAVMSMEELENKRIKRPLSPKQLVMKSDLIDSNAWYEDGDRLIEHVFQQGAIPASVTVGSIVDIKLFRQGAEDSIVIAKATVISKVDHTLCFYLNLSEQEYLKEAAAEGLLFIVQYLDAEQPASQINYSVPHNTVPIQ